MCPNARLVGVVGLLRLGLKLGHHSGDRVDDLAFRQIIQLRICCFARDICLASAGEFAFDRVLQIPGASEEVAECGRSKEDDRDDDARRD